MDKDDIYDRYFFAVGQMVHVAAGADDILCCTLERLTGLRREVAEAIFYAFDSFPGRKNLVERVLVAVKADQETKDLVDTIISAVSKANKRRNEVAHATIGGTSRHLAGPVQFRRKLQGQQHNPVTDAYLKKLMSDAGQAERTASKAYEALMRKIPMRHQQSGK